MSGIGRFETSRGTSWKIRFRVPLAPGSMQTKQITETLRHCKSRKDAEAVLSKRRTEVFEGEYRPRNSQKPVTVAEAVETFLSKRTDLRDHAGYARTLRNHVVRLMGKQFLFAVTTGKCEDYRRTRFAEGAAKATVRKELRYLQSVFVQARKDGIVEGDPVADVSFKGIDNARTRVPSPAELHRLVEAALRDETFARTVFFVLMCTGLRIGSALALRWEGVNFKEGYVEVEQKGGKKVRPPMSSLLRAELERWKPWSISADGADGWVFPALKHYTKRASSRPMSKTSLYRQWEKLLADAKVEGVTRHDMRRWMVTALKSLTSDGKTIGAVSGHTNLATIDRYDQGARARAMPLVEAVTDLKLISKIASQTDQVSNSAEENASHSEENVATK